MIAARRHIHELEALSEDDSWRLFKMTGFGQKGDQSHHSELVDIGQLFLKNVSMFHLPLKWWEAFCTDRRKTSGYSFTNELGRLKDGQRGGIEPILKLSYYHLDPPLKTCFAYCALFPKDHVIEREKLISLWMAQNYLVPREDQSIEDVGEEYFSILVKRCFFQNIKEDIYGKIVSCKIHDLMHDIAQGVASKEICTTDAIKTNLDSRVRHLSYGHIGDDACITFAKAKIRTWLCINPSPKKVEPYDKLLRSWTYRRTLDLRFSTLKNLPDDMLKLLHLRYLDLSHNYELEVLPNSFSKLRNLQTLCLQHCWTLRELPKDLPELMNLRVLDVISCLDLHSFPKCMGRLTCLQKLPLFLVGDSNSSSKQSIVHQMEELEALTNLKGMLDIRLPPRFEYAEISVKQGGYIRNMEHLNHLRCLSIEGEEEDEEMPWRCLHNLQRLSLYDVPKVSKLPKGMRCLKALQHLCIWRCSELESMPEFMRELTSLTRLGIGECSDGLKKRCQENTGEDWLKIQHIPRIEID